METTQTIQLEDERYWSNYPGKWLPWTLLAGIPSTLGGAALLDALHVSASAGAADVVLMVLFLLPTLLLIVLPFLVVGFIVGTSAYAGPEPFPLGRAKVRARNRARLAAQPPVVTEDTAVYASEAPTGEWPVRRGI